MFLAALLYNNVFITCFVNIKRDLPVNPQPWSCICLGIVINRDDEVLMLNQYLL